MMYQMRLVAQSLNEQPLESNVAIDVIIRGMDAAAVDRVRAEMTRVLEGAGTDDKGVGFSGLWAGIGRGEYVDSPITLVG